MIGVIPIETENRMKEIAGNLKRDVNDLLGESANIVAGFLKQGVCTVRGMANRWKDFTQDVSGVVGTLFKPFENALPPSLPPEQEPMVTVMESTDPELPVGTRLTLYEAETRVEQLNRERWLFDEKPLPVKVAIDYTMEGKQDRYWLPLRIGAGCGTMLEQMDAFTTACLDIPDIVTLDFYTAPPEMAALLHEYFGPQVQGDLEKLSTKVLGFFQQHCGISQLAKQFETEALAMPEKQREKFRQTMGEAIVNLRQSANTGKQYSAAQHEQEPPARPLDAAPTPAPLRQEAGEMQPKRSVKFKIQQIKEGQQGKPGPQKGRTAPQR